MALHDGIVNIASAGFTALSGGRAKAHPMRPRLTALAGIAVMVLAGAITPARATSNYDYKHNEYVIIRDGMAPDKKFSIAAHGEGDGGNDNFHLYLMAEPAHSVIVPLDSINSDAILDTGPDAFHARWSPDSGHVAILFRSDRHILTMLLYEIRGGRPEMLAGPSLFSAVTRNMAESTEDYDLRTSVPDLTWLSATTFSLQERRLYNTSEPKLERALGAFAKHGEDSRTTTGDNNKPVKWYFVDFSAQGIGELVPGRKYRVKDLKPGQFD
jgi:hypothetical protein